MRRKYSIIIAFLLYVFNVSAQDEAFKITHGPYMQDMSETGVTIIWTTNRDAISWVEIAPDDGTHFYLQERPKYYSAPYGFKNVGTIHSVSIEQLKPNTTYRYRIYSQEVLSHQGTKVLYGNVVATNVYRQRPLTFTTNNTSKSDISFLIFNDIHGLNEKMEKLWKGANLEKPDLVFFNGDMVSDIRSEEQLFGGFMDLAVKLFASEVPMYYTRGNHETRGNYAHRFADYFPGDKGQLYYIFRQGPVSFLVLDSGEDKPDSDIEYSGIVAFDAYREKQARWLKDAVQTPLFKDAPYRIVIMHMPPFGGWHGEKDVEEKLVPLLQNAGIDMMFSGHLHRQIIEQAKPERNFPIVVNSNMNIIKVTTVASGLKVEIINEEGKTVETLTIPKK
jgi:Predicted phosphohydrolases